MSAFVVASKNLIILIVLICDFYTLNQRQDSTTTFQRLTYFVNTKYAHWVKKRKAHLRKDMTVQGK